MKKLTRLLSTLIFICFLIPQLQAGHILGGQLSYKCLGGNLYEIKLVTISTCPAVPAGILAPTITIFKGDNQEFMDTVRLTSPTVEELDLSSTCNDPSICLIKSTYSFEHILPNEGESYHITYQRCCLNFGLVNINEPAINGHTYTIELSPAAMEICNNSPVFDGEMFACSGTSAPINFDHSFTDEDGDSLAYEFCPIFFGGGTDQINFEAPNGVAPHPDLPPPYNEAIFNTIYTAENPIGGDPLVEMENISGLITGTPALIGQYIYSVCVNEFKDGILLSRSHWVMQHQVEMASPIFEIEAVENLYIFPNPADNLLSVELPQSSHFFDLEIINMDGKKNRSFSAIPSGIFEMKIGDLPKGIYLLKALNGDGIFTAKWVKK